MIGHTKCAAGAVGLIKAAMALQHQVLPPTVNVEQPNPKGGLVDGPLYVNVQSRPWLTRGRRWVGMLETHGEEVLTLLKADKRAWQAAHSIG